MVLDLPSSPSEMLAMSLISALDILPYGCTLSTLLSLADCLNLTQIELLESAPTWSKAYAAAEAAFFLYSMLMLWSKGDEGNLTVVSGKRNKTVDNEKRRRLFAEILHELEGKDKDGIDQWLKGWFYRRQRPIHPLANRGGSAFAKALNLGGRLLDRHVPACKRSQSQAEVEVEASEMKRGNIEELLAGIFFDSSLKPVLSDPLTHHSLTSMIHSLEIRRNHRFLSGHSLDLLPLVASVDYTDSRNPAPALPSASPTHSSLLQSEYRPLIVYAGLYLLEAIFGWIMYLVGFSWVQHRVNIDVDVDEKSQSAGKSLKEKISVGGWWHPGLHSPGAGLACFFFVKLQSYLTPERGQSLPFTPTATATALGSGSRRGSSHSEAGSPSPILFIPGLAGPAFLLHLIIPLIALQRPILVTHQPHFSLRLFPSSEPAASIPQLAKGVRAILASRGHVLNGDKFISKIGHGGNDQREQQRPLIIAHSLGSGLASYLNNNTTHPASSKAGNDLILLDPINVLLCNPRLTRSTYLDNPRTTMERMVRYFTRSPCVASYLAYEFNPFDAFISLRPPTQSHQANMALDRGGTTKIILARDDHLIPVQEIVEHCQKNQVSCEVMDNLGHGAWLASIPSNLRVFSIIRDTSTAQANFLASMKIKGDNAVSVNLSNGLSSHVTLDRSAYMRGDMVRVRSRAATPLATTCAGAEIMSKGMSMGRTRSRTIGSSAMKEGKSKMGHERMDRIASSGLDGGHVIGGTRRGRSGTVGLTMGLWA
ncbi:hypothetical protein IAT40_001617 [Kwoniella sp. CBS 6097]